ncbi:hypothetical protein MWU65_10770 [Cellulophaga sp. F20128]|uniref:BfmA/BtgA family mobilization protein n=1 Tax=Cellulophaga sp. F20128 TaxID=2926413 RepID=UPI001FF6AD9C|nr:BfmA/BtgA family mobilization protein [Cellulophaga sp. F20128]MCK0157665.1 hypothetical protein [Cellulophaga sp. F20128]
MKVKKQQKNTFSAISINRITAERFREYSKTVAKSHTETIDTMIDFFEKANITPKSKFMMSFYKFQKYMVGRLDYIIELLREHERKYHKPTHDMLKALFEGNTCLECAERKEPLFIEPMFEKLTREEWNIKEETVPKKKYDTVINERNEERKKMFELLEKITLVKPRFSKAYHKLEIDATELAIFKRNLKDY